MPTVKDLADYLEQIAPLHYQMSYDNSGLLVGDPHTPIRGVLISLDCIEATIDEAIEKGCNVVVAHHPIIFGGLKRLTGSDYVQRTVIKAIQHSICLYAIHTNLDSVLYNGVNTEIASRLGLLDTAILAPDLAHDVKGSVGAGIIGRLEVPMEPLDFLQHLRSTMQTAVIKHTALVRPSIQRIALCGGAGGFLLAEAKNNDADIFITSDYKYHEYFDADGDIIIADIGHYESEQFTVDLLHRLISDKFSTFAALKTTLISNPISYYY